MNGGASPIRNATVLVAAVLGLVLVTVVSLFLGGKTTDPGRVVAVLFGASDDYLEAVLEARFSRAGMGALAGGALAVAGSVIQGITRNPLGDPGLLGVTWGAAAAVATASAVTGTGIGAASVPVALMGAIATIVIVYLVGGRSASGSVVTLLLTGAVVSAVLTAYLQTLTLTRPDVFDSYRFWVIGALGGRGWDVALTIAPALCVGWILALVLAPALNNLALGEDVAASLGTPVPWVRAGGILAAGLLAAAATAGVGPISFVGLAVPHAVRSLVGPDYRWQIPVAAFGGGALLIAADVVGRVIARPEEIMVGIVTAFIGAPFVLFAVRRGWAAR